MDMVIYVIGFIGSDRMAAARTASEQYGIPLIDLREEIERRDGRSIRRMVITMGEHELRNKEYETLTAILRELEDAGNSAVICCTDDLILDPMSADLVRAGKVIVAEDDPEDMLLRAAEDDTTHYAFLTDPDKNKVREKFFKLYEQRLPLYESYRMR